MSKKLTIPTSNFNRELAPSTLAAVTRAVEAGTEKMLMIDPRKIELLDGFNVRIEDDAYRAHIDALKASIRENGFYPNKPLGGFLGKDGDTASPQLTDGYSRHKAVMELIAEGVEIERVPFVPKPAGTTLEDLIVALVQDNEGRPLSAFEKSLVVKRLAGLNMEEAKIAARLDITPRYVSDLLILAGAPVKVRGFVITGKVSATEAVKQLRKDAAKAADVLAAAIKKAEERGKSKATAKDTKAAEGGDEGGSTESAPEKKSKAKRKSGMTASVTTRDGRVHQKLVYFFKAGDILPVDEVFKAVRLFRDATWWNFVDADTKTDVLIEETIEFTVSMEYAETKEETGGDADDTFDTGDTPADPLQIAGEAASGDDEGSDTGGDETAATDDPEATTDTDDL